MDFYNLRTKRVELRPIREEDYAIIFEWHFDPRQIHLWWDERHIQSYSEFVEDFDKRLRYFFFTFFIVIRKDEETDIPVGFTYTSRFNSIDRYVYSTMYLTQEHTGLGIGPEAGRLHIQYLFSVFNIRKIYAEIYGYNEASIKAAKAVGFVEEGRLKQHRWFNGRYWDLLILALYPTDF